MSRYDVTGTNSPLTTKFRIDAGAGGALGLLKGNFTTYPHYGQLSTAPTADEELKQLRVNALVRAVSVYTIPVAVEVDPTGQWVDVTFEAAQQGEFFDNASTSTNTPNYVVTDITDTLGVGGMTTTKTKSGLQTLATAALATTEGTDGAGTTLFDGSTVLADGTTPTLAAVSTVTVTYVGA